MTDDFREALLRASKTDDYMQAFQTLGELIAWYEERLEGVVELTEDDVITGLNLTTGEMETQSKAAEQLAKEIEALADAYEIDTETEAVKALTDALLRLREARRRGWVEIDGYRVAYAELIELEEEETELLRDNADAARELGFTFSSAFEDAIVKGEGVREILRGLEQDLIRMAARRLITEPLGNAITSTLTPNAKGNVFSGSILDQPTLFPMRNGIGLAGEAGPEAIMPLARTATGELGVKGGGNVHVEIINNSGAEAAVEEETTPGGGKDIRVIIGEAVAQDIQQGGMAARALRETFGLQRRRRL